jgi:phosphoribosyl 1,2-cyclic phosphate phosphodiesterase
LRTSVQHIDAVLYTHPHADHLHGIDDLRGFCSLQKAAIPVFGNDMMMSHIEKRFAYTLASPALSWDKPVLTLHPLTQAPFTFQDIVITPIPIIHGKWPTLGYRVSNMAYITDVSFIPESSYARLQGLDVLFLSCLRLAPHPTHFGVEDAIAAAQRIAAKKTVFIHMTHELEYHAFSKTLPEGIEVGYDGMVTLSS